MLAQTVVTTDLYLIKVALRRFSKPPPTRAIFTDEISLPEADMLRTIVCNTVAWNCDGLALFIQVRLTSHLHDFVVTVPKPKDAD